MVLVAIKESLSDLRAEAKSLRDEMLGGILNSYSNSQVQIAPKGKPYLENRNAGFSISHSGRAVLCAVNAESNNLPEIKNATVFQLPCGKDYEIGADIEKLGARDIKRLMAVCNKRFSFAEKKAVETALDKEFAILEIWTKKEAYLKLTGVGIAGIGEADTVMLENDFVFHSKRVKLLNKEYVFSVCVAR